MRRLSTIGGVAMMLAVAAPPSTASAHAELASSDPANGTSVQAMPTELSLTLSEPVRAQPRVAVTSADGTRVNSYDVTVTDDTVTTAIPQAAPAGTYTVSYQVVSADDHPVTGSFTFDVLTGRPASPSTPTPAASTPPSRPADDSAAGRPQIAPAPEGSTTVRDAVTVIGFFVVAMTGLVLVLRAGLKSAGGGDED